MKSLKAHKTFGGLTQFWEHESSETKTKMAFSTFIPEGGVAKTRGCLIWLSGLTCNEENFITKAGAQRVLAETGLMVVCPDTSPRGLNLANEHESWDFGSGAGFYVDATTEGYRDHYRMQSYIQNELYDLIQREFKIGDRVSIFGHSMGGHGAMTLGLKAPEKFRSVSAFSPIVNPVACAWGEKAFTGYLGADRKEWAKHDATELVRSGKFHPNPMLIDQGTDDQFLEKQLLTKNFVDVTSGTKQKAEVRMQAGYDHSYYFISTFVEDHIRFHQRFLV
jgi:S-formylglutathione hydrolase